MIIILQDTFKPNKNFFSGIDALEFLFVETMNIYAKFMA